MEDHAAAPRFQPLHDDRGTGQSGVTAKWHFGGGGKPAEKILTLCGNQKSRFRQIVFGGDSL